MMDDSLSPVVVWGGNESQVELMVMSTDRRTPRRCRGEWVVPSSTVLGGGPWIVLVMRVGGWSLEGEGWNWRGQERTENHSPR